ncbi:hypothetical protein RHECNPAF_12210066 [Rhizobium etli CNPAF512]|nr:hypothetical protein RHECNPAF_12210066 [Rhizobium etli CNPAF512]
MKGSPEAQPGHLLWARTRPQFARSCHRTSRTKAGPIPNSSRLATIRSAVSHGQSKPLWVFRKNLRHQQYPDNRCCNGHRATDHSNESTFR